MIPLSIKPMLATAAPEAFDSKEHLFELKWDGIRCLAFVLKKGVRLQSRGSVDLTEQFPELMSLESLPAGTVLDGELVMMCDERPSLSRILERVQLGHRQRRHCQSESTPAVYVVFDLLYFCGRSLCHEPLIQRRAALEELFRGTLPTNIVLSQVVREHGKQLFATVADLKLEGIMAKYIYGPYLSGKRSRNWLKIKPLQGR